MVLGESIEAPGWEHDDYGGPLDRMVEIYGDIDATCLAVGAMRWDLMEPNDAGSGPPVYDWSLADASIDPFLHLFSSRLVVTHASIYNVPAWMNHDYGTSEFWVHADRFIQDFADYMNSKGIYYFVWENEPNMLSRSDWADYYMERLQHAYAAIKAANPANQVIGGNLSEGAAGAGHFDILYSKGLANYCDVIGHHPYSDNPSTGVDLGDVIALKQVMNNWGDGNKKIWLGEGWGPKRELPDPKRFYAAERPNRAEIDRLREFMYNGYQRLSQFSYGYDPNWLLGALFFTYNDNKGGMHWADRATPVPGGCMIDGIFFDGCHIDPHHYNGGLIDLYANAKSDIIWRFPDYVYRPSPTPRPNTAPLGGNLIANGDFEGGFTNGVANGWTAFDTTDTGHWQQYAGRSGGSAQGSGEDDIGFNGGILQQFATTPGEWYGIEAWIRFDQLNYNDPDTAMAVGWDTTGQTSNPRAETTVWSIDYANIVGNGEWIFVQHMFEADGTQASVWFWGGQEWASPRFFMVVDDVVVRRVTNPTGTPNTPTPTNTPAPPTATFTPYSGTIAAEDFETMPSWSSSYDAGWGSAASWSIVAGGQAGNYLRATRGSQGSSAKVKVYTVPAYTEVIVSGYMRCPYFAGGYWAEFGYRLGNRSAQDFDENAAAWTLIKKFDSYGAGNGNGDVWTYYSSQINTGSNTQLSIGYKLGSSGGAGPAVGWDTVRIAGTGAQGPTSTPTSTPTFTPTRTPTSTPTFTPTRTPTRTPTSTPTNTPTGPLAAEDFQTMPSWTSSYDAGWGVAASWSITAGGQSGNYLNASRPGQGSSAKVKVYSVPQNTNLTISIYMRCPSMANYWMETAYRLGSYSAQDFDQNSGAWTLVKKFDSYGGQNGNGNSWTYYAVEVYSGSNTQLSIGYKLGSSGTGTSSVGWDTLRIVETGGQARGNSPFDARFGWAPSESGMAHSG